MHGWGLTIFVDVCASQQSATTFTSVVPAAAYIGLSDGAETDTVLDAAGFRHERADSFAAPPEIDRVAGCYVAGNTSVTTLVALTKLIERTMTHADVYAVARLHLFDGLGELNRLGFTTFADRHALYQMRPQLADLFDVFRVLDIRDYLVHGLRPIRSLHHSFIVPIDETVVLPRPTGELRAPIFEEIQVIIPKRPLLVSSIPFVPEDAVELMRRQSNSVFFDITVPFQTTTCIDDVIAQGGLAESMRVHLMERPGDEGLGRDWVSPNDARGQPVYSAHSQPLRHYVAEIEKAYVGGDSAVVIANKDSLIQESMYLKFNPNEWLFNVQHMDFIFINNDYINTNIFVEAGIAATIDRNSYYHWHVDVLGIM